MKSFTSFFTEARVSQASQQAERRGLIGDGHGNWMDKEGNISIEDILGGGEMIE